MHNRPTTQCCFLVLFLTASQLSFAASDPVPTDTSADAQSTDASEILDSASNPCGDYSQQGCCEENTVFYCENDEINVLQTHLQRIEFQKMLHTVNVEWSTFCAGET